MFSFPSGHIESVIDYIPKRVENLSILSKINELHHINTGTR